MDRENPEDMLMFDIKFALSQYPYKPPPRFDRDPDTADRYYNSVARAILEQIKLSWLFELKPPTQFVAGAEPKDS